MTYFNKYGLLNAHEHEDVSENTPLFSLEHIILKKLAKEDPSHIEVSLIEYIEKLRNPSTNRFNNIPDILTGSDAYISHDQYTTICAFSHRHGLNYHKEFWSGVKYGTYDNISGKFNVHRVIHPRDLLYIGYLNDNILCKLLMPLFCLMTIQIFLSTYKVRNGIKIIKTDGQLLTLVRNYGLNGKSKLFNWTFKLCEWISRRKFNGGYKGIFKMYFPFNNHPNHILADQINNYNLD